ncbi:MAG: OmpA family protein [Elusimicrobia bacterium]|nr:OmpA family protein [Elusimicrobiota bacterium]
MLFGGARGKKQRGQEQGSDIQGLWMIPYADLMSTLVILFLGFYAYAQLKEQSPAYEKAMAGLQKELARTAEEKKLHETREKELEAAERIRKVMEKQKEAKVIVSAKKMQITFQAPVLFDSGQAELKASAAKLLDPVALALEDIPNAVVVEGHTDNRPVARGAPFKSNFELSALRAFAVIQFLTSKGLDSKRFSAFGYGEHRPVAGNETEENRSKNRRIELFVVREQ